MSCSLAANPQNVTVLPTQGLGDRRSVRITSALRANGQRFLLQVCKQNNSSKSRAVGPDVGIFTCWFPLAWLISEDRGIVVFSSYNIVVLLMMQNLNTHHVLELQVTPDAGDRPSNLAY